ncbi:hypothetical protein VZT92_007116 [Zoarces viviparus]|uniref:Uncharacterized protein n=1 Tax=Zoarces viviparus TaxID=48416 RepID=A0AAW1FK58_ZOAVI
MGWVSGDRSITGRKRCLSASLGLQQLQRPRTSRIRCTLAEEITEDLDDNGRPQSEAIRSVSPGPRDLCCTAKIQSTVQSINLPK